IVLFEKKLIIRLGRKEYDFHGINIPLLLGLIRTFATIFNPVFIGKYHECEICRIFGIEFTRY
ncbi:hypothetical protein, partial [Klebsiella pneumoniae]|uniref:hypothetical protein n=1 Tax=Klebsiella pneumoniae TaxID=573 RepID=UPI001954BEA8